MNAVEETEKPLIDVPSETGGSESPNLALAVLADPSTGLLRVDLSGESGWEFRKRAEEEFQYGEAQGQGDQLQQEAGFLAESVLLSILGLAPNVDEEVEEEEGQGDEEQDEAA